jgi:hypothetical protein
VPSGDTGYIDENSGPRGKELRTELGIQPGDIAREPSRPAAGRQVEFD